MTFFYDLNKRMAELSQKQTLSEGAVAERATGDYSATKARAGKDIGKPGKNFEKIAKSAGQRYGSKAAGERVAGAVLNKLRGKNESQLDELSPDTIASYQKKAYPQATTTGPKSDQRTAGIVRSLGRPTKEGMDEAELDEVSRGEYIKQQDTAAEKSGKQKFNAFGQTFDTDEIDEGGLPMTTVNGKKVPKFAADGYGANDLAKKKSFNDKIAGAKQEVEEMLGDVAAEAMRSALGGKKQMADEGFDDMERDVKRRLSTPKVGDVRRGARHDIETTATGVRATRRNDDEEQNDQPTGEKRRAGRPKGADKGPERVTGKAYKHKGGRVKEDGMEDMIEPHDSGEYDREGDMAKDSIKTVVRHAQALEKILGDNDNLPEWVQAKLAKIEGMMTAVDDYMQNQEDDEMAMGEEKTSTRDSRAERAGRKVAKDIEYDEKKKDGIHGKRRGSEDDRAEKAGKRVTKDIEYDEKKKEKKVDETTTSGSVATGGDAPKGGKGGMQVGKGIYDSLNRKVEGMIAESMSINVSMTNDDNGSHKNITVTAADEDAEMLAQLLRSAGLGGGAAHDHGHEEPCPDCGSTDCGCDEGVAEAYGDTDASQNEPNWPTDTEYSDDAMQYSGGLNGPKSTGQTTVPVIAHQGERTGVDDEELRRMMEMAGIKQQELKPWERTMKESAGAGYSPEMRARIKTATPQQLGQMAYDLAGDSGPRYDYELKMLQQAQSELKGSIEEGVVDKVKDAVKKGLEKLGHGSDKDMIKDLQKKTGVPATGEKPADKKMEESLMQEFANFRI